MVLLVPLPASEGVDRDDMEIGWHFHPESGAMATRRRLRARSWHGFGPG